MFVFVVKEEQVKRRGEARRGEEEYLKGGAELVEGEEERGG